MDIPGFYYDPERKKYFRITSGNAGNVFLTETEAKIRKQQDETKNKVTYSKCLFGNFVNSIIQVEQGFRKAFYLREHLMKIRINDAIINEKSTCIPSYLDLNMRDVSPKCIMAKFNSENNTVYGIWSDFGCSTIAKVQIDFKSKLNPDKPVVSRELHSLPPCCSVIDADYFCGSCEIVCCLNHQMDKSTCLFVDSRSRNSQVPIVTNLQFEFGDAFKSCAVADSKFSLGGDKQVKLFHYGAPEKCVSFRLPWTVTALKFGDSSSQSQLLAGTSNGFIRLYDIRAKNDDSSVPKTRVGYHSINSLVQVDSNKWLVAGHSNNLCLLDRRSLTAPLIKFAGHVNSSYKLEPSADSVMRVVCSPGQDCITRFWSLDSGTLLSEFPLTSGIKVKQGHLLHSWLGGSLPSKSVINIYGRNITQCTLW